MSTESSKANVSAKSKAKGQGAPRPKAGAKTGAKAEPKADSKADADAEAKAAAKAEAKVAARERDSSDDSDEELADRGDAGDEIVALPLPPIVRRLAALAAIAIGWGFIAWHNHFYFTPAVVMLALGWAAGISTFYFLWRTGAAGATVEEGGREDWWRVRSEREELEREKRALLKTIREIEFDQQTGKLSEQDANEMTQIVRVRAIEVMKELDAVEEGGGVRAEIARELRARLEIEKARKAGAKPLPKGAAIAAKPVAKPSAPATKASEPAAKVSQAQAEAPSKPDAEARLETKAEARSETAVNVAAASGEPAALEDSDAASGDVSAASAGNDASGAANDSSSESSKGSEVSA